MMSPLLPIDPPFNCHPERRLRREGSLFSLIEVSRKTEILQPEDGLQNDKQESDAATMDSVGAVKRSGTRPRANVLSTGKSQTPTCRQCYAG